jgi:hypothetical protein
MVRGDGPRMILYRQVNDGTVGPVVWPTHGLHEPQHPAIIERFGRMMQERTTGTIPFRKAYIRSIVEVIEVDDRPVRSRFAPPSDVRGPPTWPH